jgi:hypothetical protein
MIRTHHAAVAAALNGVSGLVHYQGQAAFNPAPNYVVSYTDTGRPGAHVLSARSTSRGWRVATLYVGSTYANALRVAELTEGALLGVRLTIAGRECTPVKKESSRPVEPDPDDASVFSGTDVWVFASSAVQS